MATCRSVINRAYQMAGIVPLGEAVEAEEMDAGLAVLQSIYDRVIEARDLTPVLESGTYEAGENERITGASTVNLPTEITDTVTGEDRAPLDIAVVQYDTGAGWQTYISDRGNWTQIATFAEGDEAPFSDRNSEGLSALVALELSETYPGAAVGPITVRKARRFQTIFTRQQTIEPEYF